MSTDFAAIVPPQWAALVRPYLARAAEFQDKQPVIAYYLKTHAAFVCMKNRSSANAGKEGTQFLMKLLQELESEKQKLGAELDKSDGRTVLTRMALMLFTRGDDMERAGEVNATVVKLFYTSSVLFEATSQYLDGVMDPLAQEKCKYAKYVATKMKRCLDTGAKYTSHNPLESCEDDGGAEAAQVSNPGSSAAVAQLNMNAPPPQHQQTWAPPQQPQPAPLPPYTSPPVAPPPPAVAPSVSYQSTVPSTFVKAAAGPSMDAMIDAQKFCKQAVSALQFYDHENAKKQLQHALALLNGT